MPKINRRLSIGMIMAFSLFATAAANPQQTAKNNADNSYLSEIGSISLAARQAESLALYASKKAIKSADKTRAILKSRNSDSKNYSESNTGDGYYYRGQWLKIRPNFSVYHGYGLLSWPNANSYAGAFTNGNKNGYGVFQGANQDQYQGEWSFGNINGYGVYTYSDQTKFEGYFVNGRRSGYGVLLYPDGIRYEGQWQADKIIGYGIKYLQNGTINFMSNR